MDALTPKQKNYLLHVQASGLLPGSYICGQPWDHMPGTHVGGYANHSGRACTVVRWIPLANLLPRTMLDSLKGNVRAACGAMAIPIVHALGSQPDQCSELTMSYGGDPETACPGIKRGK